jgi:hypothetical protein
MANGGKDSLESVFDGYKYEEIQANGNRIVSMSSEMAAVMLQKLESKSPPDIGEVFFVPEGAFALMKEMHIPTLCLWENEIIESIRKVLKGKNQEIRVPTGQKQHVLDTIRSQLKHRKSTALALPRYPEINDFNNSDKMNAVVFILADGRESVLVFTD